MKTATMKMAHAADPAEELRKTLGDISKINIYNNWILCAVYKRPEKTASGLYLADSTRKEDEYQGKVGLVVKKGPLAFVDDDKTVFAEQNVDLGNWVVFRSSDGWALNVNGVLCRMLQDIQVRMAVPSPDMVF
jgi:co-chaperonin GroES (HSP10)